MISLVLLFGFLCRSSIFRYPDDLRNIVQQCARQIVTACKAPQTHPNKKLIINVFLLLKDNGGWMVQSGSSTRACAGLTHKKTEIGDGWPDGRQCAWSTGTWIIEFDCFTGYTQVVSLKHATFALIYFLSDIKHLDNNQLLPLALLLLLENICQRTCCEKTA